MRDGDSVTAVVQLGKLAATGSAFTWHGFQVEVVTWGDPKYCRDSSQVQERLRNVPHIQATSRASAAILDSGTVVTLGRPEFGGDSSQVSLEPGACRLA